jgi:hypothetical protein
VTFSTITGGKKLGGYYSFVEDFKRDKVSATKVRKARYGNGWVKPADGEWQAVNKARFTADRNPATTINAGLVESDFFLATGGETQNVDVKLNDSLQFPAEMKRTAPVGLPKLD